MRQRHLVDERRALHDVGRRIDVGGVVHGGRDALRQHARLRHVVDALDLDVLEVGPVRGLIAEPMRQVVELKPHVVLEVLLERHATNFLRHACVLPPAHSVSGASMIYRPAQLRYRTRNARRQREHAWFRRSRSKNISCRPDTSSPGCRRSPRCRRRSANTCWPASPISANGGSLPWTRPGSSARCWRSQVPARRPSATPPRLSATPRSSNDFLAKEIQKRPDRYSGFAHLAMQDAKAAADELERCVKELKFCGAMINNHTNGQYLDDPSLNPFWERAEALGTLIYLHPADPVSVAPVLQGHPGLRRATWEWGFETGSHALRLIFGGVFDRFPRAQARPRPSRRDPAVPALAVRQPRRAGFLQRALEEPAVALHQTEHLGHDIRHVLGGAAQLHDRGARRRPHHVRRRLSVREGRGSRPLVRPRKAR